MRQTDVEGEWRSERLIHDVWVASWLIMQLVEILSKNRRPYFGDAGFIWLGGDRQLVLLRPLWGIRSSIEGRSELKTDTCCCKEPQESVDWWPRDVSCCYSRVFILSSYSRPTSEYIARFRQCFTNCLRILWIHNHNTYVSMLLYSYVMEKLLYKLSAFQQKILHTAAVLLAFKLYVYICII